LTGRAARTAGRALVLAAMLAGFALIVIGPPPGIGGR
jgi:hypothetical protein